MEPTEIVTLLFLEPLIAVHEMETDFWDSVRTQVKLFELMN